ncbi:MAG: ADP-glyceromanno-heptose 6-epimerase [Desulfobacteraceae bacterium]|nr:ADP-glyceromanno-heptose 6-epimerase [Desulfobacteraceae bacterium]
MYIVTGGAGFIGSAVVWSLNDQGEDDIIVVDNLGRSEKWKNLVNRKYTDYIHRSEFLDRLESGVFNNIEAIIHMGACSSTTERDADFLADNNFHYSVRLASFAVQNHIRFINASSAATYGDGKNGFEDSDDALNSLKPMNMYGYSKHLFDLWADRNKVLNRLASLKFFNVFGPNEYHKKDQCSVILKAYHQIKKTGRVQLFKSYREIYPHGGQRRDFVYVKDCVSVIQWLLEHPDINGIFNVGTGIDRSWNALASSVFSAMNVEENIEYIDMPEQLKDRYQYYTRAKTDKLAEAGCTIACRSLEKAVADYVQHYLMAEDIYL